MLPSLCLVIFSLNCALTDSFSALQDRKPGPAHIPMSEDELQREQMMASMKAAGLGGQMYSRDDMMSQLGGMGDLDGMSDTPLVGDEAGSAESAEGLQAHVAKAKETVQEAVGQAKEAAAAVVDKAGSFLKGSLSKLSSSFGKGKEETSDEEL